MWGVETLASGELVGLCGFFPRPKDTDLELGYVIRACDWGRGYATEAVRAAVGAVTEEGHRIYATIRPWNTASIVVAERAGLEPDGEVIDARGPLIVYPLPTGCDRCGGAASPAPAPERLSTWAPISTDPTSRRHPATTGISERE